MKICQFCNNKATHQPVPEMEKHGVKVFFCNPCQAEYVLFTDSSLAYTSIYTEINQKLYRWTISSISANLYQIGIPGTPGVSTNQNVKHIKHFNINQISEINPSNIKNKLKLILTFL